MQSVSDDDDDDDDDMVLVVRAILRRRPSRGTEMSGKDLLKSHVMSWWRKVYSDWEVGTSSGTAFQVFGPAAGKARLPT